MKGKTWSQIIWVRIFLVLLLCALIMPAANGAPVLWSYSIDDITALSVSENGDFIAIGCEDGWYYIFDTWGNRVGSGHVSDAVVSLDITDTGDLIMGFSDEYTFCTVDGTQISSVGYDSVRSVSISSDGSFSLSCARNNVLINQGNTMVQELEVSSDFPFGVISSDGTVACAASDTDLIIFEYDMIFENDMDSKQYKATKIEDAIYLWSYDADEEIHHIFVSEKGESIIFTTENTIGYIDVEMKELELIDMDSAILTMAATPTGDVTVVATENELIWLKEKSIMGRLDSDGPVHVLSLVDDSLAVTGKGSTIQVITSDGTLLFTYDVESAVKALEICQDLLVVCTENSIYTFRLFQKIHTNTNYILTASRKSLPLISFIEEIWSVPVAEGAYFRTADVDGDGLADIILKEGTKLRLLDGDGNQKSMRDLGMNFDIYHLFDVDGDTISEIPMTITSTEFIFSVHDWGEESSREYKLGSLEGDVPLHKAGVMPLAALDGGDGSCEIIGEVGVGYSCKPRGIISVDYKTGNINWFYQMKGSPMSRAIADINGDGTIDIVVGSMAPCTCPDDKEYPDCEIYVTALSCTGEKLWEVCLGYGFRRVEICAEDVDEYEGVEIVGFGYEASEVWGSLFVLNCCGEYLYSHEFGYSIVPGAVADIDGDGTKEIVTAGTRGYLTVYTGDLQLKSAKFVTDDINTRARLYLNDFNGDGFPEIFLILEREVFIFDKDLNVLWQEEFPDFVRFGIVNFFQCKNTMLVLSDRLYAFEYETGDSPCPLWEITERTFSEEGTHYKNEAEAAFAAGEYRISKSYYENALDRFEKFENQEMVYYLSEKITEVSTIIFKQDVRIGMVFLIVCDGGLFVFLLCYWGFRRVWSRLGEGALLLSLPVLLGLFQAYSAHEEYLQTFVRYTVPFLISSTAIILRQNILGFSRMVTIILSGHRNMLVLSIARSDQSYRVSIESIEEKFYPVNWSERVTFSPEKREDLIKKVKSMMGVFGQFSSANAQKRSLGHAYRTLRETGIIIYQNFFSEDFSDILEKKFILLEAEDTEIPWELMYSDNFFSLKYAISRRIVSTEPVSIRHKRTRKRRALIISDPRENMPGAENECEIIHKRLIQKMDTVLIKGCDASSRRIAHQFGQGFDIIHFAGHISDGLILSDGVISSQEVREFIAGTPIVFVNGRMSEELACGFLLGGAMAFVGTVHPIHNESAATIASDFYDLCLQYQVGEALRKAREYHMDKDLVWATLVMYGDPTLKLL